MSIKTLNQNNSNRRYLLSIVGGGSKQTSKYCVNNIDKHIKFEGPLLKWKFLIGWASLDILIHPN